MKKKLVIILIIIIILTIIASLIGILINNHKQKAETQNLSEQELIYKEYDDAITEKIASMSEIERIQTYYGEFLNYIELDQYERAYNTLNEGFKNTYFQDIETFKEYVNNNYPESATVVYNSIDRYGDIFVLNVSVSSTTNDEFESFDQNIVIHEFSAHNYTISFEIKQ